MGSATQSCAPRNNLCNTTHFTAVIRAPVQDLHPLQKVTCIATISFVDIRLSGYPVYWMTIPYAIGRGYAMCRGWLTVGWLNAG